MIIVEEDEKYLSEFLLSPIFQKIPMASSPSFLDAQWYYRGLDVTTNMEKRPSYGIEDVNLHLKPRILVKDDTISKNCDVGRVHQGANEYYLTLKCGNKKGNKRIWTNNAKLYQQSGNDFTCGLKPGGNEYDHLWQSNAVLYCGDKKATY